MREPLLFHFKYRAKTHFQLNNLSTIELKFENIPNILNIIISNEQMILLRFIKL